MDINDIFGGCLFGIVFIGMLIWFIAHFPMYALGLVLIGVLCAIFD